MVPIVSQLGIDGSLVRSSAQKGCSLLVVEFVEEVEGVEVSRGRGVDRCVSV